MTTKSFRSLALWWLVIAFFAIGCRNSKHDAADLGPPDLESSKAALIASLNAWKADQRASGVIDRVETVDRHCRRGTDRTALARVRGAGAAHGC